MCSSTFGIDCVLRVGSFSYWSFVIVFVICDFFSSVALTDYTCMSDVVCV